MLLFQLLLIVLFLLLLLLHPGIHLPHAFVHQHRASALLPRRTRQYRHALYVWSNDRVGGHGYLEVVSSPGFGGAADADGAGAGDYLKFLSWSNLMRNLHPKYLRRTGSLARYGVRSRSREGGGGCGGGGYGSTTWWGGAPWQGSVASVG